MEVMQMATIIGKLIRRLAVIGTIILASAPLAWSQRAISSFEARNHVGEYSKVCGRVASTHFANRSRGAPTFINLDQPYPEQVFTVLIWVEDRAKFGSPENRYADQKICVSGVIHVYRGTPEIILRSPRQVEISRPAQ
jgi:hypothetical protein